MDVITMVALLSMEALEAVDLIDKEFLNVNDMNKWTE